MVSSRPWHEYAGVAMNRSDFIIQAVKKAATMEEWVMDKKTKMRICRTLILPST